MNQETINKVSNSEYESLISKSLKNSSAKEKSITVIIDIFSIYSLVILSFLCGSTWIYLILIETKINIKPYLFFIILSPVFLIFCEIFLKVEIKFFVYAIFYFLIQQIDNKFLQNNDYLKIRKNLTMLVMISHIIMLIGIYSDSL